MKGIGSIDEEVIYVVTVLQAESAARAFIILAWPGRTICCCCNQDDLQVRATLTGTFPRPRGRVDEVNEDKEIMEVVGGGA